MPYKPFFKICEICNSSFLTQKPRPRFCSQKCFGIHHRERIITSETRKKISIAKLGKKLSENHKNNIGLAHKGKRGSWGGTKNDYRKLHKWVIKKLGKLSVCEICKKSDLRSHQIHWANKSGKYLKDITDWLRLCVKCHKRYDLCKKI